MNAATLLSTLNYLDWSGGKPVEQWHLPYALGAYVVIPMQAGTPCAVWHDDEFDDEFKLVTDLENTSTAHLLDLAQKVRNRSVSTRSLPSSVIVKGFETVRDLHAYVWTI